VNEGGRFEVTVFGPEGRLSSARSSAPAQSVSVPARSAALVVVRGPGSK